jgi:hypothetical protein
MGLNRLAEKFTASRYATQAEGLGKLRAIMGLRPLVNLFYQLEIHSCVLYSRASE